MQPGEGSFDDPAVAAEAGAVLGLAASDDRLDAALPDEPPVPVVVVSRGRRSASAVCVVGDRSGRARWHPVEQLEQLGDVVAVAAGERPGERDATPAY